jgi:hypothetical protein
VPPDGYATYGGAHSLDGKVVQARAAAGLPSEGSSPNGVQQDPASMISDSRTSHASPAITTACSSVSVTYRLQRLVAMISAYHSWRPRLAWVSGKNGARARPSVSVTTPGSSGARNSARSGPASEAPAEIPA